MKDSGLENLIRLAVESDGPDDLAAASSRTPACLTMGRLGSLVRAGLTPTREEWRHLSRCRLCRARYEAFQIAENIARPQARSAWRLTRGRWVMGTAVAAAAMAAVYVLQLRYSVPDVQPRPVGERCVAPLNLDQAACVPILLCHDPEAEDGEDTGLARFRTVSEETCYVVALFRACDEGCRCLGWELFEWDSHGHTMAALSPDQTLEIALSLADASPVGQILVLASSGDPEDLPGSPDEAAQLLACLDDVATTGCTDEDMSAYASAVHACLPENVTLVQQTFFSP
ncbi:MAG: hypothetical protein PVJ57_16405 [Phycisphaerae bacterium]